MSWAVRIVCAFGLSSACACGLGCGDAADYSDRVFGAGVERDAGTPPSAAGTGGRGSVPTEPAGTGGDAAVEAPCIPAVAADHLRPRSSVMSATTTGASSSQVFTRDLFNLFRSHCGGCHVDGSSGGLHVELHDFQEKIGPEVLARIVSDDPDFFMPPANSPSGKPFSERDDDDPVVELASLFEAWLAAGKPAGAFARPTTGDGAAGATPYLLPETVAMQMTNLANCVPDGRMFAQDQEGMDALDERFADATELPERLEQTDVVTFDAAELARTGVIAFAPAYTLWADNAKKIRMLRVPRGESIAFDAETQAFTIPPSTRFYKTFLKRVIDRAGNESYRKMETRLIVSRPDDVLPDGSRKHTALFGTYAWNEQETEAVLVRDPLRNGRPFRDRLITYVTDEPGAEAVIDDLTASEDLLAELEAAGVTRTYAIPGSERCIHCHMGSPSASFVLGFTPLQINRRPMGEGGVIEPAERDELNQLQRLIDYGVITGMSSPDDVRLLEDSQGDRKPRNDYELVAQGYMLGNCAHCHNPFGFPSVAAPELRDVLNFMPGETGGIFQFPLDKFSPRIFRGSNQQHKIAYITPSLYDLKVAGEGIGDNLDDLAPVVEPEKISANPKVALSPDPEKPEGTIGNYILAPWRSLIYRNVDNPFSYADDSAIFPHMPRDTAGYDCRVRQIMGSWMASIPAYMPRYEEAIRALAARAGAPYTVELAEVYLTALDPQPYVEVKAGDPEYSRAERATRARLRNWTESIRYNDCPPPSLDIVDPRVTRGAALAPAPQLGQSEEVTYQLVVPERPHWAVTDLTDAPGEWYPRRADWRDVLIAHREDLIRAREKPVLELLESVKVSGNDALREFALTDVPFGLWVEKEDCSFPGVRTVADVAAEQPQWLDVKDPAPADTAHVYEISPGAQVFTAICRNCHGPEADARGRLADTIADLTGGDTRVANLRDGILGPFGDLDQVGKNRERVFGEAATEELGADDWAGRYIVWMGLGGTQRTIPPEVLNVVGNTYVLGVKREGNRTIPAGSANMLTVAQFLCGEVLPDFRKNFDVVRGTTITPATSDEAVDRSSLIFANGDAEMWQRLCSLQNPRPVRVVQVKPVFAPDAPLAFELPVVNSPEDHDVLLHSLYRRAAYPPGAAIGSEDGSVAPALDDANRAPWCIQRPVDAATLEAVGALWSATRTDGSVPPYCPDAFVAEANRLSAEDVHKWTLRGAMNAGLSVFVYLDAIARGEKQRVPEYDHCEDLNPR